MRIFARLINPADNTLAGSLSLDYSHPALNGVPSSTAMAEKIRPNPLNLNRLEPA
ncbi:MAG: hypothetical protein DHS20C01_10130 [marine bacterium B5-7]|nr:MAG: hypothetical protein DHS20C01_10130 [marine bacterium B5-7]